MNTDQKTALRLMDEKNLGAIMIPGHGYAFPTHIRGTDKFSNLTPWQVAEKVIETLRK